MERRNASQPVHYGAQDGGGHTQRPLSGEGTLRHPWNLHGATAGITVVSLLVIPMIKTALRTLFFCSILSAYACAQFVRDVRHGTTVEDYRGQVLSTKLSAGAERLRIEIDHDPTIRHFVEQIGSPDYIRVESAKEVTFFYLRDERVVLFRRLTWRPNSDIFNSNGIPDETLWLFTESDRKRVLRSRPVNSQP